ncbi:TPA: 20S proteasome subunit A/B, partial [Stenotrophomonas maltophilia]|nr:20S proteasome subunit A/B [Stenotrophomonas maltophilia]
GMPASGRHYRASALRFGYGAEDQLHLLRLEQAVDALPRFPWETAER